MMIINAPNIISFSRILIAPFVLYLLIKGGAKAVELACLLYFIASASDFLDGWIARKYHEISRLGKFLDPLADKALTTAAFIAFVILDIVSLWMVLIILIRDFGTTLLRLYADQQGKTLITSITAKWKTFLQMLFIAYILILILLKESVDFTEEQIGISIENIIVFLYSDINYYIMLFLVALSIWTIAEYIFNSFSINIKNQD